MIEIAIPGYRHFRFDHLVLDYNGTLAHDGNLIVGVRHRLNRLAEQLRIHVVTADTFGKAAPSVKGIKCEVVVLGPEWQAEGKRDYIERLGFDRCVCVGNGRNDRLMLEAAGLGIAVAGPEGLAVEGITASDIVVPNIVAALDLLQNPLRLVATLRA